MLAVITLINHLNIAIRKLPFHSEMLFLLLILCNGGSSKWTDDNEHEEETVKDTELNQHCVRIM